MPRVQWVGTTVTTEANELDSYDYRPAHPPWWPGSEDGYEEYHRALFVLTAQTTAFNRWKTMTTGINIARQLAGARNKGRAAWVREHGADVEGWPLPHPPAVVWFPSTAYAACLRCWWLGESGEAGLAASSARRHAASFLLPGDVRMTLLLSPLPVWHRRLSGEERGPRWAG